MSRLEVLTNSLAKKETEFDRRWAAHAADVHAANGQPLNDKRNGASTMDRWEKQEAGLRRARDGIEKTKAAIEREQAKVARVANTPIPDAIRSMVDSGELVQWRKNPNTFFVPGVERGRIVWDEAGKFVAARYHTEVPKEQYAKFRDTFNKARAAIAKAENP